MPWNRHCECFLIKRTGIYLFYLRFLERLLEFFGVTLRLQKSILSSGLYLRKKRMSQYRLNYLEATGGREHSYFERCGSTVWTSGIIIQWWKGFHNIGAGLIKKHLHQESFRFPLVHIDTGHNFPEALAYRDWMAKEVGAELIVRKVEDTIKAKKSYRAQRKVCQPQLVADVYLVEHHRRIQIWCLHRWCQKGWKKSEGEKSASFL